MIYITHRNCSCLNIIIFLVQVPQSSSPHEQREQGQATDGSTCIRLLTSQSRGREPIGHTVSQDVQALKGSMKNCLPAAFLPLYIYGVTYKLEAKIKYLHHNENDFLIMSSPLQAGLHYEVSIAHCGIGDLALLLQNSQALLGKMDMVLGARTPACTVGTVAEVRELPTQSHALCCTLGHCS